jgi:hypothetical protein
MLLEATVAPTPAPAISTTVGDDGMVALSVSYADAVSGQTSLLTFTL